MMESSKPQTPSHLHDGVKAGILASIREDVEHRGGPTARRLVAAGMLGVIGALGITRLVLSHPLGHHPPWHIAAFSTIWAGLLFVALAVSILRLRTPSLPLAEAATVGIAGLGLAGICGAICSDQHFLHWWSNTPIGASTLESGGPALSAMCFGFVITLFIGAVSAVTLIRRRAGRPLRPILAAAMLLVLLTPGIALQSFDTTWWVFGAWMLGTGLGAYLGVVFGAGVRNLLRFDSA